MAVNRLRESKIVRTVATLTEILLDTSFAMKMLSQPMPSFGRIEDALGKPVFIIIEDVIHELEAISNGPSLRAKQAKAALTYTRQLRKVPFKGKTPCDDKILRYAEEKRIPVATLDDALRRNLRKIGITVITLKGHEVYVEGKT
ncbi:MAG: hypothetical protein HYU39_07975 [Thaumarchaeota archaeon]|nr:hypothetical protein [Nitrososphaerota archaeon]